ncbi:copper resistance protein B, partial [Methylophaga sp.]|uniref:copper resistance protein B n=1 Tax=Methylophaga sp. TaxID=2024840 RepID=UPI003F69A596
MQIVKTLIALSLLSYGTATFAQHAEGDWPEPMKTSLTGQLMVDRFEISQTDNGDNVVTLDAIGWYGGDEKRLYIKTEGENQLNDGEPSELESAEILASQLIAPFWEVQAGLGLRGSVDSDVNREHYAVFSLFGLAPYRFEV